eukprot:7551161-Prorocentrum_lima.AAC.1
MTSSLVGSEMCIRDRNSTSHTTLCRCQGRPCVLWAARSILRLVAATVSYTHLTLPTICSV